MREYGKVLPAFWTKGSGKRLRGDLSAQLVALYLFTCPSATMTGLFYLPLPTLAHETGLPLEGALKALLRVCEAGIASYDQDDELVWVPEMARIQIGDTLAPRDLRIKGVEREIAAYRAHPFYGLFVAKYRESYRLAPHTQPTHQAKPLGSPLEAPLEALRSQEQDQEQEQDHRDPRGGVDQGPGTNAREEPTPKPPPVASPRSGGSRIRAADVRPGPVPATFERPARDEPPPEQEADFVPYDVATPAKPSQPEADPAVDELLATLRAEGPVLAAVSTGVFAQHLAGQLRDGGHTGRLALADLRLGITQAAAAERDRLAATGELPKSAGELAKFVGGCVRRIRPGEAAEPPRGARSPPKGPPRQGMPDEMKKSMKDMW